MDRREDAIAALDRLLTIDPSHDEARRMRESLREGPRAWLAGFSDSYDWFSDEREPWREEELSLRYRTPIGPVIGRVARASHFSNVDAQFEIEAYPRFRPGTYAYAAFAFSPSDSSRVYPDTRFATDLYQGLGRGFEASIGYRRLRFSETTRIYVGSLTKYYGNLLFTGGVYAVPGSPANSRSYHAIVRRYFGDGTEYY